MSHCTCETCICFMLKVFILCSCGCPCLRVWWAGASFLHAMDNFCPTQTLLPTRNCLLAGGGKRYSPAGYQSLVWSPLKTNQSLIPEWTMPNLKGCPCSHIETNRTITPDKHRLRKGKRVRRASEIIRCAIFSFCDSAFIY